MTAASRSSSGSTGLRAGARDALLGLVLAALLLQGGSLPHTHDGHEVGLYNQEHDLTLLATLSAVAALAPAPPAFLVVLLPGSVSLVLPPRRRRTIRRHAGSRAPPLP